LHERQWADDGLIMSAGFLSFRAMLRPDYLSRNLTPPIPTKDGGTLRTIGEACEYMAAIGKEREQRRHWQQVRELMLQEADVAAVSRRVRLAVLKDAKVDVTALSEPMERWMDEPSSGFLSNGKLNVVEKDEPSTEPTEGNERSDSESEEELRRQEDFQQAAARRAAAEEERRRQEELQRAEARQAAEEEEEERRRQGELQRAEARQAAEEEERRRQEELQRAEARRAAEDECRRQEELQRAEARQAAEEEAHRQREAENKPFWNRFLAMLRARDS
jgi:hypothetical protein